MHCCKQLREAVDDPDTPIRYVSKFREYGINILDGGSSFLVIEFCPFCGKKLPRNLRDRWFDELEKAGFEPGDENLPAKYTDERWHTEDAKD